MSDFLGYLDGHVRISGQSVDHQFHEVGHRARTWQFVLGQLSLQKHVIHETVLKREGGGRVQLVFQTEKKIDTETF